MTKADGSHPFEQMPSIRQLMEELDDRSPRRSFRWFTWGDFLRLLLPLSYLLFGFIWVLTVKKELHYYGAANVVIHGRTVLACLFLAYMAQAAIQAISGLMVLRTAHLDYASNIDRLWEAEIKIADRLKHFNSKRLEEICSRLEMEIAFGERSEVILIGIPVMLALMKDFKMSYAFSSSVDAFAAGVMMGIIALALLQFQLIRRLRRLLFVVRLAESYYKK